MNRPNPITLRTATIEDVGVMTDIYAHHVLTGTGSFEEVPPTACVMLDRWQAREADKYPTLIAQINDQVAGFAYAGNYKPRAAYRYTVEDSIYVAAGHVGQGVGRTLLQALVDICIKAGYKQMMAVIGDSANRSSIALHERCGFLHIGTATGLGFKHDKWLDVIYMQRELSSITRNAAQQLETARDPNGGTS